MAEAGLKIAKKRLQIEEIPADFCDRFSKLRLHGAPAGIPTAVFSCRKLVS
jgi:hypothetical protein